MLLQRCIKPGRAIALSMAMLLIAACAAGPGGAQKTERQAASKPASAEAAGGATAEIPARVLTMYEQAAASMASGDYVDAELRFKEFLLQYPGYPGAHVNLAIIHANNQNDAATQASVDSALALDPNHPAALNQLGMLLRRNGKFLEAEAAYLKAVTVSPEYALAHYNLGVLNELYLQRLDTALQHFETYQSLVGEDKQVAKWISDLTRRVAANQRTANVAD
ncbi:MAG: tetratricopeptide repeat protein [Gammaproteobacteria bacterium]|nr:tetratricopeptide repeat protein [Gammaproteobacteria bacterium]